MLKPVLIKLSGEVFNDHNGQLSSDAARLFIKQLTHITTAHHVSIVIGGGNFFRGSIQGASLKMRPQAAHYVGMHATVLNGLILKELMVQEGLDALVVAPHRIYGAAEAIEPTTIARAQADGRPLIFVGGTGAPFVTTDTAAIIRALQVGATTVIKATNVDGVYDKDPRKHADAVRLERVQYADALRQRLGIMDATALVLAQENNLAIKVVCLHAADGIMRALQEPNYGSTITN